MNLATESIKRKRNLQAIVGACLFLISSFASAVETHTKLWSSAVVLGHFDKDSPVLYYLEPDLRFIDDRYKFSQARLWLGLGYQFNPTTKILGGVMKDTTRTLSGDYNHSDVIWQQYDFRLYQGEKYDWYNRLRLQEIKRTHEAAWAIVLRERVLYKFPLPHSNRHAIAISDEVFLNLKHPDWTSSNRFISQNRFRVSLDTQLSRTKKVAIAYMNQFEFRNTDQMSNVFLVAHEVKA